MLNPPAYLSIPVPHDPELTLYLPAGDRPDPEVTIVIPACNEELTIGTFVEWAQNGLRASGSSGEILIVSSSTDRTREIALAGGARVLAGPRRGLGRAYIDAMPFIRGRWVLFEIELATGTGFPFFNLYRSVVILRGRHLIRDVAESNGSPASGLAQVAMAAFDHLFRLNSVRCGWPTLAIARWRPAR